MTMTNSVVEESARLDSEIKAMACGLYDPRMVALRIDGVPSAKLLPNASTSDRRKRDLRSAWRKQVRMQLLRRCYGLKPNIDILQRTLVEAEYASEVTYYDLSATIYWPGQRRIPDTDGALSALKGALDGAADALGVDDRLLDTLTIRQRRAKPENGDDGCVTLVYTMYANRPHPRTT